MKRCLGFAALLLLGACEPSAYWDGRPAMKSAETSDTVTEVAIDLPATAVNLSALQAAVENARAAGTVSLDVVTPPVVDADSVRTLTHAVGALGLPADRIRRIQSASLPRQSAMVRVHAVLVKTPPCAGVPTSATSDDTPLSNRHYVMGCATANNFAAMLADPRDLSAPPALVATDGERATGPIKALLSNSGGQQGQGAGKGTAGFAGSLSSSSSTGAPSSPSMQ